MRYLTGLAIVLVLSLSACSNGHQDQAKKGDHGKGTVFWGQTQGINKAHHAEKELQKGAERQRKAIEKQSK